MMLSKLVSYSQFQVIMYLKVKIGTDRRVVYGHPK